MNSSFIICGSGASVPFSEDLFRQKGCGIPTLLEEIIKNNYSSGINSWYRYGCETTFSSFCDYKFYRRHYEDLKSVPLIIGKYEPLLTKVPEYAILDNTILLPNAKYFWGEDCWDFRNKECKSCGFKYPNNSTLKLCDKCKSFMTPKGIYCYDKETEVLTDQGFKFFKDLDGTELIATLNEKQNIVEYHKPLAFISYNYNGALIHELGKRIDLLVTPNHKMYTKLSHHRDSGKFGLVEIQNISGVAQYRKDFPYFSNKEPEYFILPKIKNNYIKAYNYDKKILMKDWLSFYGWYLSEGCCYKDKGGHYIVISQSKIQNLPIIEQILSNCGFKWKKYKNYDGFNYTIINKQLYEYLKDSKNAYSKYIKQEFMDLSPVLLNILFNNLILGDGTRSKSHLKYATVSEKLKNQVYEIGLKLGYTPHYYLSKSGFTDKYCFVINFGKTQTTVLKNSKREKILYNDLVYCVNVPNHIIYVRRNGKSCWSGNCHHLSGGWNISLAIGLGFKKIFLLGCDACEIDGKTHFYQNVIEDKKLFPGVGTKEIKNKKVYNTSTYNNPKRLNENWYEPFRNLLGIEIYNVSLESKIDAFKKISYADFYKFLGEQKINQEDARNELRQFIESKTK